MAGPGGSLRAQDRTVLFDTSAAGVTRAITNWGLDTAWYDENNVRRGAVFMGSNRVDVVRISFTTTNALVAGELGAAQVYFLTNRLRWVDKWANPATTVCINEDSPTIAAWYYDGSVMNSTNWAANIVAHAKRAKAWGRTVVGVAPFNEPDLNRSERPASKQKFYDTAGFLVTNSFIVTNNIRISGGNTLNADQSNPWYNYLKARLDEGNTHQLAGTFDNYAAFFQNVVTNGDHPSNDELHNVMEAMVGAEYGMKTGIWWGTAERTRGEFVKTSDGQRLAYAEHRANWTAASVYRGTNGAVQAFVGESERQALPTTYRFFSRDRDVFYDGDGPRRDYTVTTTGGSGYQTTNHHNAEKMVNITWGADVPPAINGRYFLVNRKSLKVMDVYGGVTATGDGPNINQWSYTGNANQQWDVNPLPNANGGDYSYFTMLAAHSGKAADLQNWNLDDGGNVQQWTYGNGGNQHWFLEYVQNGWFRIGSRWSGKYLEVNGGSSSDGANIQVGNLNVSDPNRQQWRLIPVGAAPTDLTAPTTVAGVSAVTNARSVRLNWSASSAPDLAGYTVLRSTNSGGPYEIVARGLTTNTFTDKSANLPQTYFYVVKAADKSLNTSSASAQVSATPTGIPALVARHAFDGNTNDSSGNANHPIITYGTPTFVDGKYGPAMDLDGTNQYTMLPANMLAGVTNFTIALWVNWDGGNNWQRIFDFGNDTTQYMFLTPKSGDSTLRFSITTNGGGAEQILQTSQLPAGQWRHVAITLNGTTARLYTNGVLVATNIITIAPASFNPALNYLGKSQWPDPLFNGRMDELHVCNYALSDTEISALINPPPAPTGLVATPGNNQVGLSWNAVVNATNYNVKRATVSGGPYGAIASPVTTNYTDTTALNGTNYYYVVSAVSVAGEGTNSSQVTAMPVPPIPPPPAGLVATATATNQINLSWNASSGAASYNVKRSTTNDGPYVIVATGVTATNYNDTGLASSTAYYYVASAVNAGGESPDSAQASATTLMAAPAAPAGLTATAVSASQISLIWNASANATSYKVKRSTTNGGPYTVAASDVAATNYSDTGLAGGTIYYYVVSAVNVVGEGPDSVQAAEATASGTLGSLVHRYCFSETNGVSIADSVGGPVWNGTLPGGGAFSDGRLTLSSNSLQYASLPAGMVNGLTNFTIMAWVNLTSASDWNRLFDFGNGTTTYMFLTPQNGGGGTLRFAISTNSYGEEQQINSDSTLTLGVWHQVAVTLNTNRGILYLDGVAVGTNTSMTLNPAILGVTTNNYLGKSQYPDPYFDGSIDEFRIYNVGLSAAEVAQFYAGGPSQTATVTLGNLSQTYDGTARSATATTTPSGLTVDFTYNGSANAPTNAGSYTVIGAISDTNYQGSATNTLVIGKGAGAVNLGSLSQTYDGTAKSASATTTPSGLTVNFTYNGSANAPTNAGSYTVIGTISDANYQGSATNTLVINDAVSTAPVNVSLSVLDGQLNFSWPADHKGWRLQVQTNALNAGLGTNWFDVAGSAATNNITIPVDANSGSVFYRLIYP